ELGGVENAGGKRRGFLLEPVAPQSPRHERGVERPHRPDVVTDRVVPTFALRERSYAPAGEESGSHKLARDRFRLRLVDDPAPEEVADVRRERVDLAPVLIECKREVVAVLDPEVAVEAPFQVGGLLLESIRELRVLPDMPRQARAAHL